MPVNKILQKNEIKNHSKKVTSIRKQVIPNIEKIKELCNQKKIGNFPGAYALAHCQVEKENPLRFFVTKDRIAIVNPVITSYSDGSGFMHKEGCLSFARRPYKKVKRFNMIYVEYIEVRKIKWLGIYLKRKRKKFLQGLEACIFQHEIDHFTNKYIY